MEDIIARVRRTSKLGILGEVLAAEALVRTGFRRRAISRKPRTNGVAGCDCPVSAIGLITGRTV